MPIAKVNEYISYNKPRLYKGEQLKGTWEICLKIDGIRAFINLVTEEVISRANKPLYGFTHRLINELQERYGTENEVLDCEVFRKDWETTQTLVRTINNPDKVIIEDLYILDGDNVDRRLHIGWVDDPELEFINEHLIRARLMNQEGLVLKKYDRWLKVKPFETYDVKVTGITKGKGKYDGNLGAIITDMGKVGTGLTDKERWFLHSFGDKLIGMTIEVKCMELTKDGKFRHPVFIRLRFDK